MCYKIEYKNHERNKNDIIRQYNNLKIEYIKYLII